MQPIPYKIIRSNRKSLGLEITPAGDLVIRAPRRMSQTHIDRAIERHRKWIENHRKTALERQKNHPEPSDEQRLAMIERAKELIPRRVAHYSAVMGLVPTGITITGAQKRFGSCSGKNRLCFSWRLMDYPDEAIDYVVVHELAHIRHHNHSRDFYALVASILPDYKERQALLRR